MYNSLEENCLNFHLYVIAFDDITYNYLQKFPKNNLTVISLNQFEDEKLLSIKLTRSASEYCWTCTASTVLYCLNTFKLSACVYIDADMRFYSNPQSLFDEWGNKSVLITEHRYNSENDQSLISGIYCVQFVGFKNDVIGIEALTYWRNSCIDWCYARAENGKFGDQKYLDDWTTRFNSVHVLQHLGGGIAPWNVRQYQFSKINNILIGKELKTGKEFEVVFFHFHGLKFYLDNYVTLTGESYKMNNSVKELFYKPYVKELDRVSMEIHLNSNFAFNANGASVTYPKKPFNFLSLLRWYLYDVRQNIKNINGQTTIKRVKPLHYIKY